MKIEERTMLWLGCPEWRSKTRSVLRPSFLWRSGPSTRGPHPGAVTDVIITHDLAKRIGISLTRSQTHSQKASAIGYGAKCVAPDLEAPLLLIRRLIRGRLLEAHVGQTELGRA
jgi:hypothetical protein